MFSTPEQVAKRTGKNGLGRKEFLKELVTEFRESPSFEVKRQVLANLANFAYDPINYEHLRNLQVIDIFLDELSKSDNALTPLALGGLCNLALDPENKEYILHCNGVKLVSSFLVSSNIDVALSSITTLMFLMTPESKTDITSCEIITCMLQLSNNPNQRIHNLAHLFLEDYCTKEQVAAAEAKITCSQDV